MAVIGSGRSDFHTIESVGYILVHLIVPTIMCRVSGKEIRLLKKSVYGVEAQAAGLCSPPLLSLLL